MKKMSLSDGDISAQLLAPIQQMMSSPLSKIAHLEFYQKGEKMIHYDQGTDQLYVLLEGKAKIYMIHEDGKQSIVHFLHSGELIGELTLLGVEEQTKDVVAQTPCLCLAIPLKEHQEALLNDVVFLQQLSVYLAEKLLKRTNRFSEGLNYPLINRLAAFILYTEHDHYYHEKHTEVAEYLGVSYRHLLHTFQQLRSRGLLQKAGRGDRLINRLELEKLAKDIRA